MRLPVVTPGAATRAFRIALGALCLIVVTGAGVRLTDSGLGCPDWPTCNGHHLVSAWQYHAVVEFGNRVVTVLVTVAVAGALLAAWRRVPRRTDLVWMAAGLVGGVVAQAVLGGITVLAKLAPGWVMAHFLLSMAVIALAVLLVHRSTEGDGVRTVKVGTEVVHLARALVGIGAVVLGLGTVVTGAGPHAGSTGVGRLPISPRDAAELHSGLVLLLIGATLATVLLLRVPRVPPDVARRAQLLLYAVGAQGAIGYIQYFSGVPAALVGLHVVGAIVVWVSVLRLYLSLTCRVQQTDRTVGEAPGVVGRPAPSRELADLAGV